jgi:hypothetical protein
MPASVAARTLLAARAPAGTTYATRAADDEYVEGLLCALRARAEKVARVRAQVVAARRAAAERKGTGWQGDGTNNAMSCEDGQGRLDCPYKGGQLQARAVDTAADASFKKA